jgi:phosphoribosylaminoimidazole carboxylase (NCAIR synthetase)
MTEIEDIDIDEAEETTTLTIRLPVSHKDEFIENTANASKRGRSLVAAWNQVEDDLEVDDDIQVIQYMVLKTYRNAIDKNIQAMQNQRDQLQEKIEEFEEDDEDEILLEIDLDIIEAGL